MDSERFSQQLHALQAMLTRLQQENSLAASEKEDVLNALLQQLVAALAARQAGPDEEQSASPGLLDWLQPKQTQPPTTRLEDLHPAEELEAIIMAMAEAVAILDARGQVTRANPAAEDLFGFDPLGFDRLELVDMLGVRSPDGSPIEPAALFTERALQGETIIAQHILLVDPLGEERVARVSASPLLGEVGVLAVVTVWHDVTERERLLEQLEIEQSRLETIIATAPEAILVMDEEGRLVMSNPAGEQIFGRGLPYLQGYESLAGLQICYENGAPCAPRNFPLVLSALDGEQFSNREMLVRLPAGGARHILISCAPIIDRKGNVNGAVGVLQDITRRKQSEADLREQAGRSQILAMLSRAFAESGLHAAELLQTIVEQIGRVYGDLCSLHLLDDDGQQYRISAVFSADETFRKHLRRFSPEQRYPAQDLTRQALETGRPVLLSAPALEQAGSSLGSAYYPIFEALPVSDISVLALPLRAHGRRIGSLNIFRLWPGGAFSQEDLRFLEDLADRAALAIEDALLFEREAQRARELQALHHATNTLLSTLDLDTLLEQIMESAALAIPAAQHGILYLLEGSGQLNVGASFGGLALSVCLPGLQERAVEAAREIQPARIELAAAPAQPGEPAETWSVIVAPLYLTNAGPKAVGGERPPHALGALALLGAGSGLFTASDLRLLNSFAATATAALQNARLHAEVQRLAIIDPVTEQYNRRKFFDLGAFEMNRFRRYYTPLSAIMLDLDNFKQVNDTYGHAAGDQVLHAVAQRCRATIRVVDILGRYGGDEFAILLPGAEQHEAREIAERLRLAIRSAPVATGRGQVHVSISLGVAQATPDMDSLAVLLARADEALYQDKGSGSSHARPA